MSSDKYLVFIGGGNMASALIQGVLKSGFTTQDKIAISCKSEKTKEEWKKKGFEHVFTSNYEILSIFSNEVIVLSVKPQVIEEVFALWPPHANPKLIISIMAGISAQRIRDIIHKINPEISVPVIRIMPNTPCAIGAGASALSYDGDVSEEDIAYAKRFAECVGKCEVVPTRCYNAAAVVGGCTPGWAFMFIEALADGGVAAGLGRNESLRLAAQSVMGAAKMVLESGEHPGALKDKVCSPGGTTIEGLRVLENRGFRSAVIDAVVGATEKADRMGNKKD